MADKNTIVVPGQGAEAISSMAITADNALATEPLLATTPIQLPAVQTNSRSWGFVAG